MKPSQAVPWLVKCFKNHRQVLLTGEPGIGKSDIIDQACNLAFAKNIVRHPSVEDPLDVKGMPAVVDLGDGIKIARFLPFEDLYQLLTANTLTVCHLEDFGQAPPAVQFIAEGATESVCLVKDGRLLTPSLGTVLDSITRRSVLQVARHLGVETFEGRLRPELLFEADEIFLANTPFKVIPVRRMEDREMPAAPGPLQRRIWEILQASSPLKSRPSPTGSFPYETRN